MKVVEIFDSIEGEGIRTGQPATFIRLAGCNLRCSYCDTLYALFGEDEPCLYEEMTVEEIAARVNKNYIRVTLTGGEPLVHKDINALIKTLAERKCEINIETNGAANIKNVPRYDGLFFTIDYKLPSSGESGKMLWDNFTRLKPCDVVKFVCGTDEDVRMMVEIATRLNEMYAEPPHIFVGAVYGMMEYEKLVDVILNEPSLKDARFQIQLHKVVWDADERGV